MAVIEIAKIQVRRGKENETGIPKLDPGEFGWAQDTEHLYIGKSISEGANTNSPTRILTSKELQDIIAQVSTANTSTVSGVYKYRSNNSNLLYTSTSTVQTKLDSIDPTINDFGVVSTSSAINITTPLKNAISDLFANQVVNWDSNEQRDLRRKLIIPAGNYIVDSTIELPPYAKIVGAGPDLTKITYTDSIVGGGTSLFRTVDADGNDFGTGMQSGARRSREILIEGMTLAYSTSNYSNVALISLDNVFNARVENCILQTPSDSNFHSTSTSSISLVASSATLYVSNPVINYFTGTPLLISYDDTHYFNAVVTAFNTTTRALSVNISSATGVGTYNTWTVTLDDYLGTSTYGIGIHGTGIQIRGQGSGILGTGGTNLCENVYIENCVFDGLTTGIVSTGSVVRPVVEYNLFNNLNQGIKFYTIDSTPAPSYGVINQNRFQNIIAEGIYVGPNAGDNTIPTNHMSSYNLFTRVGNGMTLSDYTTTSSGTTSVIKFLSIGNKSVGDTFNRRTVANSTTTGVDFYYNRLIEGNLVIRDDAAYTVTVPSGSTQNICKIAINGGDQAATINYQMYSNGISRKGRLLVNVAPDGYTAITDNYNYSLTLETTGTTFTVITGSSGVDIFVLPKTGHEIFTATGITSYYYVTGVNTYTGSAAAILEVDPLSSPANYVVTTQSADPQFDYSRPGAVYQLAKGDYALPDFSVDSTTHLSNNYIVLQCYNSSIFPISVEYQLDLQV